MKAGDYFIDISSYQLPNASFYAGESKNTLIKVTESTSYINRYAGAQAKTSNPIGYYHFARFGGNTSQALAEADFFLANLPNNAKYLALDYEDSASGNLQANTDAILAFMDRVAKAGFTPILYTYTPYLGRAMYADQILRKYPKSLWIASYVTTGPNSFYGAGDSGNLARNSVNNGVDYAQTHYRWHQFADNTNIGPLDKNIVLIDDEKITAKEVLEGVKKMQDYVLDCSKHGGGVIVSGKLIGVTNPATMSAFEHGGAKNIGSIDSKDWEIIQKSLNKSNHCGGGQDYVLNCSKHGGGVIVSGKLIGVTNPATMSAFEHGGAKNIGSIDSKDWEIIQKSLNE